MFAVAKEGYQILEDAKELSKVIEEYANGGFDVISTILKEKGDDYFGYDKNFLEEVIGRTKAVSQKKKASKKDNEKIALEKASDGTEFEI